MKKDIKFQQKQCICNDFNNMKDYSIIPSKISKDFLELEKKRQESILDNPVFYGARGNGYVMQPDGKEKPRKPVHYPFILIPEDSLKNLYAPIQQDALDYFERYNISWWKEKIDRYFPTGHLASSQIHCLNHLFAIRKDHDAVLKILSAIAPDYAFEEILPSPIDDKEKTPNYISFEFVNSNTSLLKERYNTRGANCTSVDAFVYAKCKDGRKILVPIEWKYTESYDMKYKIDERKINLRYKPLTGEDSNIAEWKEIYSFDPYYEFTRQELLIEQIIKRQDELDYAMPADDFIHIIVCPDKHKELCDAISIFRSTLCNPGKLYRCDPVKLLTPLEKSHKELICYLRTRYWHDNPSNLRHT